MRYQAVLFDLDGTLLDTLEDLASAANQVLADRNLPGHPVAAYRTFVGDGLQTLMERILPEEQRDLALVMDAMAAFEEAYAVQWYVRSAPYPGVAGLLDRLTTQGVRLSVAVATFNRLRHSLEETASQIASESSLPAEDAVEAIEQTLGLADTVIEGMAEIYETRATSTR